MFERVGSDLLFLQNTGGPETFLLPTLAAKNEIVVR